MWANAAALCAASCPQPDRRPCLLTTPPSARYSDLRIQRCTGVSSAILCLSLHMDAEFCRDLHKTERIASPVDRTGGAMTGNKELESGLKAMAEDFQVP